MANSIDESYPLLNWLKKIQKMFAGSHYAIMIPKKKGIRYLFGVEITVSIRMSLK